MSGGLSGYVLPAIMELGGLTAAEDFRKFSYESQVTT